MVGKDFAIHVRRIFRRFVKYAGKELSSLGRMYMRDFSVVFFTQLVIFHSHLLASGCASVPQVDLGVYYFRTKRGEIS